MQRADRLAPGSGLPLWRLKMMLWVACACALVLTGRLFYLQVIQNSFLGGKAEDAHQLVRELTPPRGTIRDRNGVVLAANRNADRLYAEPRNIRERDVQEYARKLAPILRRPVAELRQALSGDAPWVSLAMRLTPEQSARVRELKLYAVGLDPSPMRVYPNGRLAAHVLGFANYESQGSYGIEGEYNSVLQGKSGKITAEKDPSNNWLAVGGRQLAPPESGADLELTIDATIQQLAEQELQRTIKEQKAKGGTIIVMRPTTGEVLAMAAYPFFDPQRFAKARDASVYLNPAISSLYEPGSTFKVITMAAGLEERVITPETRIDDKGYLEAEGSTVYNWDRRAHPNESMTEVLINSANVGAAYISNRIGKDAFYRHLRNYGFGRPTGIDLQGETEGMLVLPADRRWSPANLYANGYGQGIAVTPIQLITAEAAVANGGLLMKPYVVSRILRDGQVIKENRPTVVRRVMRPDVAETLRGMMKTVVEEGGYQLARLPGYTVGGKTGTASIAKGGGYDSQLTIASFVAYTPVEDPQFIALIKIDQPKKSKWGSRVAPPAFRNLAKRLYAYMNIPPVEPVKTEEQAP